jgi:Anti-sigma-K factor rskA
VTWDHDRVEELLAARALDGLDPEEAALAERALIEHVPGCPRCREVLDSFHTVAGDLALLADPATPPDTLEGRIRRSIRRRRRMRLRGAGWGVAAVATVVALALAGWNVFLATRLGQTETTQGRIADAILSVGHPNHEVVPLQGPGSERAGMVYVQGEERMYVMATRLPEPRGVYRLWLVDQGRHWSPGILRVAGEVAFIYVHTDPERWDVVMITDEPREDVPRPSSSPVVSATVD